MSEEEQSKPFITAQLGNGQSPLTFSTPEDLLEWITQEREFWEWAASSNPICNLHSNSVGNWQQIENRTKSWVKNQADNVYQDIQQHVNQLMGQGLQLTAEDPRAQFAKEVAETVSSEEGGNVLQQFHRTLSFSPKTAQAAVRATLYELGISVKDTESQVKALNLVRERWSRFTEEAYALSDQQKEAQAKLESDTETLLSEKTSALDTRIEEFQTQTNQQLSDAKSNLDQLTKTYDETLAVQSSVTYWTKRATQHKKQAKGNLLFIVVYSLAVLVGVVFVLYQFTFEQVTVFLTTDVMKTYWPAAAIIGLSLVLIWPLRIATRLYLSNTHLRIAAEERVTMVNTFLALLRSEQGLEKDDRKLILESLFRHLATGIVKDDGAPSNPAVDALNKMVSS